MDFALKILNKYGWKEGEGLGKNCNGIAKPLKATLKFDNAGFGADQAAADFNNHWWERVFNDATSNVDVKQKGETIKINLRDGEDGVEISTKGYSMKKLKKAKRQREKETRNIYDNFLQAATLTNLGGEVENPNKIDAGDIEVTKIKILTDEELFKACGGRTAHKGARHGLKLSGKLARIEKQEEELVAKMLAKRNGVEESKKIFKEETTQKKVKKTKSENFEQESQEPIKQKKKNKKIEDSEETNNVCKSRAEKSENQQKIKKKKRKFKDQEIPVSMEITEDTVNKNISELSTEPSTELSTLVMEPKKKKKKEFKQSNVIIENVETEIKKKNKEVPLIEESNIIHKKKKSKKKSAEINQE